MTDIFYAGMIPFYLTTCLCVPDVMGSEMWVSPYGSGLAYDSGGGFYSAAVTGTQPMFWPDMSSGAQSIEVTASNFGPLMDGGDIINLNCRSTNTSDDESGINFNVRKWVDPIDGPMWDWFIDADGTILDVNPAFAIWPFASTVTIRLESDTGGAYRAYVANTLISSGVDPTQAAGLTSVGYYAERYAAGDETTTVHISDICVKVCGSTPPPPSCYSWEYTLPTLANVGSAPFDWELVSDTVSDSQPDGGTSPRNRDFYYLPNRSHVDTMMQDGCTGYTATFEIFQIPASVPTALQAYLASYVTTTALGPYAAQADWQFTWAGGSIDISIVCFYYWPLGIAPPDIGFATSWSLNFSGFPGTAGFSYPQSGSVTGTTHSITGVYSITDADLASASAIFESTNGVGSIDEVIGPMTMSQ